MKLTNQDASPHYEMAAHVSIIPEHTPVHLVNVGELLAELAEACAAVAGATTPASQVTDSMFAFQRLSDAFSAASRAFTHVQLFVPKEPDSGS